MEETYERTYSQSLEQALNRATTKPSTADDYAIACALAGISEAKPPPDTSMDEELAMQLHEREATRLMKAPSKKARRRSRALRSMLHHLKPTRVIPRLNPLLPPTESYANEDRGRLLLRLDMYGLQERQVQGDGNCQFRAVADQLFFRQDQHAQVRQAVVDQLCCFPERYRDYVTTDYKEYVDSMRKLGSWGDHVTLQAAADAFHVGINIITSFLENCVITICPTVDEQQQPSVQQVQQQVQRLKHQQGHKAQGPQEQAMQQMQHSPAELQALQEVHHPSSPLLDECVTIWLSFWAEVHYNSLAPKRSSEYADDSSDSSSEDERSRRVLGSTKLGRLFK